MEQMLPQISSKSKLWQSCPEYQASSLDLTQEKFAAVTDLLLENPNFNSSHLFRADILSDSAGTLKTTQQKEEVLHITSSQDYSGGERKDVNSVDFIPETPVLDGFCVRRCILRRLVPRNPQLDNPILQSCYIYANIEDNHRQTVVYVPHIEHESEIPWYHPPTRALAYLFEGPQQRRADDLELWQASSRLSIHFLAFSTSLEPIPERLHRTMISLLTTFIRLGKCSPPRQDSMSSTASKDIPLSAFKDTILPQHLVQDTYARLKRTYAADLIARWIEKTEPSKHVFEDLSIAAFLIELWKQMYIPYAFPGFIDIACGNGLLVYILVKEGYKGRGFDARRRKTWDVLEINDCLDEMVCIPEPFLEILRLVEDKALTDVKIHSGMFKPGTFIISNHADELTPWTPLLAALSSPRLPLPFLAIPCCSHALSGAKHRYTPKDSEKSESNLVATNGVEPQPASGDLRALRAVKAQAAIHSDNKSMYACLTKKVIAIARDVGLETELTLMRIPSTRNLGIVGNRKRVTEINRNDGIKDQMRERTAQYIEAKSRIVQGVIECECKRSGGIDTAAKTWFQKVRELQAGKGRGKVNLKGEIEHG